MVHDHANERSNNNRRIHFYEHPVTLPLTDIASKEFINAEYKLIEKHLGEFVLLESRMQ